MDSPEVEAQSQFDSILLTSQPAQGSVHREAGLCREYLASFWRETKDPEGVQQDSPGRKPWVQGPNCGKP